MKLITLLLPVIFGASLSGCSVYEPKPQLSSVGAADFLTSTGDLSSTIILKNRICLQPSPDAAFSSSRSGGISVLNFGVKNDGLNDSSSGADTEMTGRTPSVLLARELMYRLCELGNNYTLNKEEMLKSYNKNLEIIKEISLSESKQTTISISSGVEIKNDDNAEDQVSRTTTVSDNDNESGLGSSTANINN